MKKYDVIIIGGGGGTKLRPVTELGKKVAVIEKEDLGGTCLNRGCIPSKMLIHASDVAQEIRESSKFDLKVDQNIEVNFERLVKRVTSFVEGESKGIGEMYKKNDLVDFYHGEARFVDDKTIEVNEEKLTAEYIFIATGTRPNIPPIPGLVGTPFMTSREALRNTKLPKKMIIIGGGYIGVELGHLYGALGCEVHFLVRSELLSQMDTETRLEFAEEFKKKYKVSEYTTAESVEYDGENFIVKTIGAHGMAGRIMGDALFVAAGVVPNSDTLGLENTSIQVDKKGYIEVDEFLQTDVPGVYALGDAIGRYLFRHSVNFEGEYLLRTIFTDPSDEPIEYSPMPYAVFSNPQVAGVGKTEDELKAEGVSYVKGLNYYKNSAMGDALRSENGFVKLLFERASRKLVGAHLVGPEASDMIHMPIAYMNMNATLEDMLRTIYIHPALPENVRNAARKAKAEFEK